MRWVIILLLALLVEPARAQDAGPFGLTWGMPRAQAIAAGVQLQELVLSAEGPMSVATKLPRGLPEFASAQLYFGSDDRLWRVFVFSKDWNSDNSGLQVRTRIDELIGIISKRYGPAKLYDSSADQGFLAEPDQFAYSISINRRIYGASWDMDALYIEIKAQAEALNTYYVIDYENKPLGLKARADIKSNEEGAF